MTYILAMSTLGERLAWARKQKNITQDELGRISGSSGSAIGNIESGTRHSSRKIAAIAAALDVDVLWLSEGKGTHDAHKKQAQHLHAVDAPVRKSLLRVSAKELALLTTYRETDDVGRGIMESAATLAEDRIETAAANKS
jgi:transcriptional regulator with XRE-family HTH domain